MVPQFATIILDFDSTLVQSESLEDLAYIALRNSPDRAARVQAIADLTNKAMCGTLRFDDALTQRIQLLQARKEHIEELVCVLRRKLTPSFMRNRVWFRNNRDRLYIVSGGFREFIVPVMIPFGFRAEHIFANTFVFDEIGNIVGADSTNLLSQEDGKTKLLHSLQLPSPRLSSGDGFSDYQLRRSGECDMFYVLTENIYRPDVVKYADRILESFDGILSV
ncbi:MAG: HAD-IB family phosphatase [Bacteroidota bacterium]|nr:HAD-IB family phosphatase [Candidatus Kapabacteria bacterium]MDW8219112.1 HAD-IB family phosphatase [Bacteroidota bacterium]